MKQVTKAGQSHDTSTGDYSDELVFWLNGTKVVIKNPDPTVYLSDYLHSQGLTGTKVGCGQGGCGACTVMLSHLDPLSGDPVHQAINSCLKPICALDGKAVTTTEGIGTARCGLDPAQYCLSAYNGTQCGFCTPGFVMNTHAFLQNKPEPTQAEIEDIFGGNLCRCTGYRPILHGVRTMACDYDEQKDCTQKYMIDPVYPITRKDELTKIDLSMLPAYNLTPRALHFTGHGNEWFRPNTLEEVHKLKKEFANASGREQVKLVAGNTASGVYQEEKPRYLIDISAIKELKKLAEEKSGIYVGASVPIQKLLDLVVEVVDKRPAHETTGLKELKRHVAFIAGYQVRSAGTVAGNVFMTVDHADRGGPFPSDLYTILSALGTTVTISSLEYTNGADGKNGKSHQKTFLLTDLPPVSKLPHDAVILCFNIPYTREREYVQTHRVARRPQMAHPIVNGGFRVKVDAKGVVEPNEATIIFGGLTTLNCRMPKIEKALAGKPWNKETLKAVLPVVKKEIEEITIPMEEEGLTIKYRRQLAENLFYKFFLHVAHKVDPKQVKPENLSAAEHYVRPLSSGKQEFTEYPEIFPLTQPFIKRAAFVQATGEIKYTQDMPLPAGGLHGVMVKSSRPHARFSFTKNVKSLAALKELLAKEFPGFKALITAEDVPEKGQKFIGLGGDDPVFSVDVVTSVGAPIGMAVAETIAIAKEAAAFIENECIAYEDLPAVLNIEEAIKQNTSMPMILKSDDPDEDVQQRILSITRDGSDAKWLKDPSATMKGSDQVSGYMHTGAQAHFYLETNCALAIPTTYDQMTVYSSTQNPNGTQGSIAKALGLRENQITVLIEQIGGGFGGKQHRANIVGAQAAVAAHKLNRPVRLLFDRPTDMAMVGKRHPYFSSYKTAYSKDGTINGIRMEFNSDAGDTYDCSFAVLDFSILQSDGCYKIDTMESSGTAYKTNKTSSTAFRTFGVIQACVLLEEALEHTAHELSKKLGRKVLPEEIRYKNMYRNGTLESYDTTHYGQELKFCNIREIWDDIYKSSDFEKRVKSVEEFNKKNRWRKRGISMVPMKYGIAFTEPRGSLNSSTAMVNVNFVDGSVTVMHGAVEIGQGVITKIAQLAANTLGIPLEYIRVVGNNTDVISNTPPTAASTGFDLNGGAVEKACRVLRTRLENFCRDLEQFTPQDRIEDWRTNWAEKWQTIIFKAWFQRINLTSAELYKTPHYKGPSVRHPKGKPFLYYSFGVAATEVEIDVLTGEMEVLRADVVCDAGKSPNPAIDIGQLEGGFVQGLGFMTTEEVVFDEHGKLVTDNIWSYKPPCSKTIPQDFRIRLHPVDEKRNELEKLCENQAVGSSKAMGEPVMTLSTSVFFAIKHAVMDARRELMKDESWLAMNIPATCQNIQVNCGVSPESLTL